MEFEVQICHPHHTPAVARLPGDQEFGIVLMSGERPVDLC